MATYANTSSINASGTWNVVDATSLSASESATTAVTTTYVASSNFTPGAITVSHIGIKLSVRTGTTGTFSVNLRNTTLGADVAGTEVTINCADFPVAATADLNGGWHFFKLSSPVLLLAATNYAVQVKTSSSSQISLFSTATTNWSRALITTATGTPTTGDDMIVTGEYTGTGTSNSYTVTWDITATTDYGSAPTAANSLLLGGLSICNKGTLTVGNSSATNYIMKVSNSILQYSGSTWEEPSMPSDSRFELQFDPGTNVDYGFEIRNLATNNRAGFNYTYDRCLLNTDEAINSTSLGVDTNVSAWPDNAVIAVGSTTRTNSQSEIGALNGAGGSTLTVDGFAGAGGGLAFAHSGTAPTQAEVILLSRNTTWRGTSASLQGYVRVGATANINWDWYALKWMGSNTTNKRGFETACTTGTQTFDYGSHYNFEVSGSRGFSVTGASGTGLAVNNYVSYLVANEHLVNVSTTGTSIFSDIVSMRNSTASTDIFSFADCGGTITDCTAVSATRYGFIFSDSGTWGTLSNLDTHSNGSDGFIFGNGIGQYIDTVKSWRNTTNGIGFNTSSTNELTIDNLLAFGNTPQNVRITSGFLTLNDGLLAGDSTFSTASGISNQGNGGGLEVVLNNCSLGVASGIYVAHTTGDINFSGSQICRVFANNCMTASSTPVVGQTGLPPVIGAVTIQNFNQTDGDNRSYKRFGTLLSNSTTVHSPGVISLEMRPNNASNDLMSIGVNGGFKRYVASGQTCTPSIYVYENGSYNGARARLWVKRNDAMGINADTLLDTATAASDGAWEELTGTTSAATSDGTLEFYISCNGTAGSLFVASASATVA